MKNINAKQVKTLLVCDCINYDSEITADILSCYSKEMKKKVSYVDYDDDQNFHCCDCNIEGKIQYFDTSKELDKHIVDEYDYLRYVKIYL